MVQLWVVLSLLTVVLYGVGQGLSKGPTSRVGPAQMLLLFALSLLPTYALWWLLFSDAGPLGSDGLVLGVFSAAVGALGYIFYYEALAVGQASLVGTLTAASPAVALGMGWLVLDETLSLSQSLGVVLILGSLVLISAEGGLLRGLRVGRWLWYSLASLGFWALWVLTAKPTLGAIGETNTVGLYAVVASGLWIGYWVLRDRAKFTLTRREVRAAELPILFFVVGELTLYFAYGYGPVSVVAPVTALYPLVTLIFARLHLRERLSAREGTSAAFALLGTVLAAFGG